MRIRFVLIYSERFLVCKSAIDNTIIHNMKIPMLIRSHTPIQGVGPFVGMFGASVEVRDPNNASTIKEAIVNIRKRILKAVAPITIITIIKRTVTAAHTICRVSVTVGGLPR